MDLTRIKIMANIIITAQIGYNISVMTYCYQIIIYTLHKFLQISSNTTFEIDVSSQRNVLYTLETIISRHMQKYELQKFWQEFLFL